MFERSQEKVNFSKFILLPLLLVFSNIKILLYLLQTWIMLIMLFDMQVSAVHTQNNNFLKCENSLIFFFFSFIEKVENEQMQTDSIILPGVLKTGLPEILSQVQHIAGNLLKLNLLKALILLV